MSSSLERPATIFMDIIWNYTVFQKMCQFWQAVVLTSIVFGKQHQHTLKNGMHIQLSLSLHFYLFNLLFTAWCICTVWTMPWQDVCPSTRLSTTCWYSTVSFRMTLSDLEWFSKIFNDTKHCAVTAELLVYSCDEKDTKQRVFLGRLLVALKRAGCVVCWLWKEPVLV